jgi:hypothetical protein
MTSTTGTLLADQCTLMIIPRWILIKMRNLWNKCCSETQNSHFMFNNVLFQKSCLLWDNVENCGTARQSTDGNIIQHMCFTCWISKATNTNSEHVVSIAFPQQHRLCESTSMLPYTYIACLVTSLNDFLSSLRPKTCWSVLIFVLLFRDKLFQNKKHIQQNSNPHVCEMNCIMWWAGTCM